MYFYICILCNDLQSTLDKLKQSEKAMTIANEIDLQSTLDKLKPKYSMYSKSKYF